MSLPPLFPSPPPPPFFSARDRLASASAGTAAGDLGVAGGEEEGERCCCCCFCCCSCCSCSPSGEAEVEEIFAEAISPDDALSAAASGVGGACRPVWDLACRFVSFRCRFIFPFDSGKRVSERGLERAKYQGRRKGEVSLSRRARSSHPSICRRREGSSWEKRHEPCSPSLSTRSSSTGRSVRQERPQAPRVDCERGFRVE